MSTRKTVQKKQINEESDIGSDIGSDIESDIEEVEEDDGDAGEIEQPSKDVDEDEDENEDEETEEDKIIVIPRRNMLQTLQREVSNIVIVSPEKRITSEYMTLYEYSKVVGTRATHISEGAPLYIDSSGISNALEIAAKEIDMKLCPLVVVRQTRNKKVEIWEVNEMTKPLL